ncbi:hypothetical protein G7Y89_g14368 [Cudoniella acicularis]|uniref:Major facilitator superfamily (MFS) profile domain-containing protein n=1 Tax=Cudoniella acicularis TaxID=354080 RepID=A0A8H4R4B4_9HELO|nr:hypothetical protein G7Y89_g14368 [Cudoniella acicularis]
MTSATVVASKRGWLRWVQLAIVCLTFFIDIANLGMCTIALPTIQSDLGFSQGALQWVLTAYSLTYGGFLVIGGRLGDIFGQEMTLKISMGFFNIFTLACALAPTQIGLVVSRAFQGIAAAFTIPAAQASVAHLFPEPRMRGLALSWWGASGSLGFVLGPIFGGLFTSLVTWRWIFWFPLIVEGFLLILAVFLLRDVAPPAAGKNLAWKQIVSRCDPLGTVLSVTGVILLIYALTSGNTDGWRNSGVISTLVISIVCLSVLVYVEAKVVPHPLVPNHLWTGGKLPIACLLAALTYAVWQGANYFLTLELQSFGFSPLSTAVRFLPLGVTAFLINMALPHLLQPVGPHKILVTSWIFAIAGVVLLALIGSGSDYWRYCFPGMILYILGVGSVYFVSMVTVVGSAPPQDQGAVAGVYNMSLNVGGAVLGLAILTVINDSVASKNGGGEFQSAKVNGYRAAFYGAIGWAVIGLGLSILYNRLGQSLISEAQDTPPNETTTATEQPTAVEKVVPLRISQEEKTAV